MLLYLTTILLQLAPNPDAVLDKAFNVNPTNVLGLLLVILLLLIFYQGWQLQKKEQRIEDLTKYIQDSDKESLEVIHGFSDKMKELDRSFTSLKETIYLNKISQGNGIPANQFGQ